MALDDPPDVAALRRSQQPGRGGAALAVEQQLDRSHRPDQPLLLGVGERRKQVGDARLALSVERRERSLAGSGEAQMQVA